MRQSILAGALSAAAVFAGSASLAQTYSAEREAAFQAMFANPGDVQAMLTYATLSAEERAFEDAASTLERVLDLQPGNLEARLDLAIAYYALGAYTQADYHFDLVAASGAANQAQRDLIAAYRADADDRDAVSSLTGFVEAGGVYSEERDTVGLSFGAGLTHRFDLGGPVDNAWITEVRTEGLYFDTDTFVDDEEFTSFLLRTGPRFALNGEAFSPRLRPYFEIERESFPFETETTSWGLGLQYSNPVSDEIAVFAALEAGWFEADTFDPDGTYVEGLIGLTWRPFESTRLRFTVRAREDWSEDGFFDAELIGARLDARHDFDPGFFEVDRDWSVYGHVQYDEETVAFLAPEDIWNYGIGLRAFVTEQVYMEGEVAFLSRDSGGFTQEDTLVRLSLGLEF